MSGGAVIRIRRGSLLFDAALYERYFRGLDGVILLRRDGDLLILPVRHTAAGGYLMKLRSARGERVVTAVDFFRDNGLDDTDERRLRVGWSSDLSALVAIDVFATAN